MNTESPKRTELDPSAIPGNVFEMIGDDWMLITAGDLDSFNTMTASWGAMGILWGKQVVFTVIRPQRYTREFADREDLFTLTFFPEKCREALNICGTKSGRDGDKVAEAGLTPLASPSGSVYFAESSLVLECRKLYYQDLDPANFVDESIPGSIYPTGDFHRMYVGEIIGCWQQ